MGGEKAERGLVGGRASTAVYRCVDCPITRIASSSLNYNTTPNLVHSTLWLWVIIPKHTLATCSPRVKQGSEGCIFSQGSKS
jgi:hypothetical protein